MKKLSIAAAFVIAVAASPVAAQTQCAKFEILGNQGRVNYNPFSGGTTDLLQVRVDRLINEVRQVQFVLVDGDTAAEGGTRLGPNGPASYTLGTATNESRGFAFGLGQPTNLNSAVATLQGNGNGIDNIQFRLTIPSGQNTAAGTHIQQLTVRYQCFTANGTPLGMILTQSQPLIITVTVPSLISTGVGGPNGPSRATIDFGTVSPTSGNLTKSIDVTALATVPYRVEVTTDNKDRLLQSGSTASAIRYAMTYAEVPVSNGAVLLCPTPPVPSGRSDRLAVSLNPADIAVARAGNYADVVTLTFTPQDTISPSGNCVRQP